MTDERDRDLVLADDGQKHTHECVRHGWWLLDWEANCLSEGVPPGGERAARAELTLFNTTLALL